MHIALLVLVAISSSLLNMALISLFILLPSGSAVMVQQSVVLVSNIYIYIYKRAFSFAIVSSHVILISLVVDAGNFDWSSGKFPDFTEPSDGYHGLKFWETFGKLAFTFRLKTESLRDIGACQSPFGSFLLLQGKTIHTKWLIESCWLIVLY